MCLFCRFKIPFIGISPMDCSERIHSQIGNYIHPVLYPDHTLAFGFPLNFKERIISTLVSWFNWYFYYHKQNPSENKIVKQHFGKEIRDLKDILKDMSFLILNVNPVIQRVRPTGMNTIFMGGGLNIEKVNPLPNVSKINNKIYFDDNNRVIEFFMLFVGIIYNFHYCFNIFIPISWRKEESHGFWSPALNFLSHISGMEERKHYVFTMSGSKC